MAPGDRREAILDAAQALFMSNGWEQVTIADVLEAADISRGGFYHHFSAKEDLLTGIVTRTTAQALAAAEDIRSQTSGDALARLNAFLCGSVRWKADNIHEMRYFSEVLTRPGNDMLYRRIFDATAAEVIPVLKRMISDGASEGTFNVSDAGLTAEIIVGLGQGRQHVLSEAMTLALKGNLDQGTDVLTARMQAEGAVCDRLLGLPGGSVLLSDPRDYRRMLAGLASIDDAAAGGPAPANESLKQERT
ncbi:TetR/AcrR family transcriptional regulator [Roseobacter ponti]|uniref:TetR/AcrR family transcriptional regulator n=2 Tax=Roseobacter ponti TaxID=1891787 RepID=A0A858SWZ7_9RHOB|nr:TetR/AcrR family transcriptional regulator [Roseobacter ponti]